MAETKIEWADYTWNPWRGCTKVSPACENCYAETLSKRNPGVLGVWGKHGTREVAAESYWKEPLKWNRKAEAEGVRKRVFCASLADVFEGDDTMPEEAWEPVREARIRLFDLILRTPNLDWLLLTKRPELVNAILAEIGHARPWEVRELPNVWIGTTVENQKYADIRIPALLKIPAKVRFLSVEPLLGPVEIYDYLGMRRWWCVSCDREEASMEHNGECEKCGDTLQMLGGIDWAIVGGESGANARPMHPDWVRSIRDQCQAAGVPFFFKQWGEWKPMGQMTNGESDCYYDPKYGRSPRSEYEDILPKPKPASSMILQLDGSDQGLYFPEGAMTCFKVGKTKAGRLLDGREWNELPEV